MSKPIAGGSLHGTPRPTLENTGTDYVAIFKSLDAQLRWQSENPDVAGVAGLDEIYVPGTTAHDGQVGQTQILINTHHRWADDNYRLISVDVKQVVQKPAPMVSLRVVDQQDDEKVVDATGVQFGPIRPHGSPMASNIVLTPDAYGRWRIEDARLAIDDPTVQL
ncbi:MAG TPA: hypothetical protein VHP57_01300, partial [Acidimicrobiia bacterium]|nr:hypothetical protein [Acidimicrobiia bacterium]